MNTDSPGRGDGIVITAIPSTQQAPEVTDMTRTQDGVVALTTLSRELLADVPSNLEKGSVAWELSEGSLTLISMRTEDWMPLARFDTSDPKHRLGLETALSFGALQLAAAGNRREGQIEGTVLGIDLENADRFAIEQALSRT